MDYAFVLRASKTGSKYVTEGAELCPAKASFSEELFNIDLGTIPINFFLSNSNNKGGKYNIILNSSNMSKVLDYDFATHEFKDGNTTVLTLGSNDLFWFGYVDSSKSDNYTYTYATSSINKQYDLNFDGHIVQVTDTLRTDLCGGCRATGIPTATLLLIPGFVNAWITGRSSVVILRF